jgi:hypothetical protein
MSCLFCGFPENGYRPSPDKELICSGCTQLLLSADQEDLNRAYIKAIESGYSSKAKAIESFLNPEVSDGKRPTRYSPRHLNRERATGPIRYQKKRIERS